MPTTQKPSKSPSARPSLVNTRERFGTLDRLTREPPRDPAALADVHLLLDRLVSAYSTTDVAEMLGVDKKAVSRWTVKRPAAIDPVICRRIIDLHYVLSRALQVFDTTVLPDWLRGSEPRFGGARPIDVLRLKGVVPVIQALNSIEAGEFA